MTFWMEREFRQYSAYYPDLDALAAVTDKIVPAGLPREGDMPFLPVVTLAGRLGRDNSPARLASPRRLEQDVVGETASPRSGIP